MNFHQGQKLLIVNNTYAGQFSKGSIVSFIEYMPYDHTILSVTNSILNQRYKNSDVIPSTTIATLLYINEKE